MTGSYLHHDGYGPGYICDVYHNEHINCSGFDLNTEDNSYHVSPQHMIKDQKYEVLYPYLLWLPIDHLNIHSLLLPRGSETSIAFHFSNTLSHVSVPLTSLIIMNLS